MKKSKKRKKKRLTRIKRIIKDEIKIDQILLHSRQVFLTGEINEEKSHEIISKLIALDKYMVAPIVLWINSGGGSVVNGLAIIDTIKGIPSPVLTIINGKAYSMAAMISITGDKRLITENSFWMQHEMTICEEDYISKAKDSFKFDEELQSLLAELIRKHTKLTEDDLERAKHGELWLGAKQCKAKGVVDNILK